MASETPRTEQDKITAAIDSYVPDGRAYDDERHALQRWLASAGAALAEAQQLRAALKEALDGWAREWGHQEHHGGPIVVPPRMLELRKLVGE